MSLFNVSAPDNIAKKVSCNDVISLDMEISIYLPGQKFRRNFYFSCDFYFESIEEEIILYAFQAVICDNQKKLWNKKTLLQ